MSFSVLQKPQVLVCQRGARSRSVISRMLEESGMLAALYTNSAVYSLPGRAACYLDRFSIGSPRFRALLSRRPEGIPASKIYSYDQFPGEAFEKGR